QKPVSILPWTSPWRFGIVADNPATVVQSNLVSDLSHPSVISGESWIKPGRASWSWWSAGSTPRDFNRLKKYVDLSASFGWEYTLVDAGWDNMQNGTLEELATYANSKNVGLLVWYNSGGPNNVVTASPRDRMFDPPVRKKEFAWLQKIGVKGVKVDFFQSDKQEIIKLYLGILKDAAEAHLLVNFHGCTMPRGWSRTYPNLLSMEAVRGGEAYRFDRNYPAYAAVHNTIIPFTRNVMGPVDFTPVTFSDVNYPHITTNAHELALSVVFQSGILHLADNYKVYPQQPEYVIDFLKNIPVSWDETRLLDGKPGEMVIIARRSADKWYIAGINGTDKTITVKPDLSFAGNDNDISLISDGDTDRSFQFNDNIPVNNLPEISMLPRGGFVAFTK
ncbi:MAG TPA: glycoside hydrolase family 97 catalytic domain-containing protein, partial [Bacteroidales bacterium]|nr:glycoside hydrolase family 97 catalytic domain-containing protein [Bacteroidales bacterium]